MPDTAAARPPTVSLLPPASLIYLVAGSPDISWFLEGGRLAYRSMADALAGQGIRIESLRSVLDFGCGCGRVTRYWYSHRNTRVSGTDFNPAPIGWCRRHLPFARFTGNAPIPPLAFPGEEFDFIYALSVFTHLPEERQAAWMKELSRVLRPGGVLLLTTHGESYRDALSPREREEFSAGRLVVRYTEAAGTNLCSVYHPPAYVREKLAGELECVDFIPEGAKGNPHQDIFLLRKPKTGGDRSSPTGSNRGA